MLILGTEYGLIRDDETLEETLHDGECAIYTKLIKIRAMEKLRLETTLSGLIGNCINHRIWSLR